MDDGIIWAVLVERSDGSFQAVTFGDSEQECVLWLKDHAERFKNKSICIGYAMYTVMAPSDS